MVGYIESGGCGPLLCFEVAVICAFDLACLHEHLRRRAVDALLEACAYMLGSPGSYTGGSVGERTGPRHDGGCCALEITAIGCPAIAALVLNK
jgi:hypothetical protein